VVQPFERISNGFSVRGCGVSRSPGTHGLPARSLRATTEAKLPVVLLRVVLGSHSVPSRRLHALRLGRRSGQ
jgi:hypothetical protein